MSTKEGFVTDSSQLGHAAGATIADPGTAHEVSALVHLFKAHAISTRTAPATTLIHTAILRREHYTSAGTTSASLISEHLARKTVTVRAAFATTVSAQYHSSLLKASAADHPAASTRHASKINLAGMTMESQQFASGCRDALGTRSDTPARTMVNVDEVSAGMGPVSSERTGKTASQIHSAPTRMPFAPKGESVPLRPTAHFFHSSTVPLALSVSAGIA
ncbi:hypothetical protein CF326_g1539 [Tilletia indica]|nr:hypothetical protein CF326_g1539 [Tilletia indica]